MIKRRGSSLKTKQPAVDIFGSGLGGNKSRSRQRPSWGNSDVSPPHMPTQQYERCIDFDIDARESRYGGPSSTSRRLPGGPLESESDEELWDRPRIGLQQGPHETNSSSDSSPILSGYLRSTSSNSFSRESAHAPRTATLAPVPTATFTSTRFRSEVTSSNSSIATTSAFFSTTTAASVTSGNDSVPIKKFATSPAAWLKRRQELETNRVLSVGKGCSMSVNVEDQNATVVVGGELKGILSVARIVVEQGGTVIGAVDCGSAVVHGEMNANLVAHHLAHIGSGGKIRGDISYRVLETEKGALILGHLISLDVGSDVGPDRNGHDAAGAGSVRRNDQVSKAPTANGKPTDTLAVISQSSKGSTMKKEEPNIQGEKLTSTEGKDLALTNSKDKDVALADKNAVPALSIKEWAFSSKGPPGIGMEHAVVFLQKIVSSSSATSPCTKNLDDCNSFEKRNPSKDKAEPLLAITGGVDIKGMQMMNTKSNCSCQSGDEKKRPEDTSPLSSDTVFGERHPSCSCSGSAVEPVHVADASGLGRMSSSNGEEKKGGGKNSNASSTVFSGFGDHDRGSSGGGIVQMMKGMFLGARWASGKKGPHNSEEDESNSVTGIGDVKVKGVVNCGEGAASGGGSRAGSEPSPQEGEEASRDGEERLNLKRKPELDHDVAPLEQEGLELQPPSSPNSISQGVKDIDAPCLLSTGLGGRSDCFDDDKSYTQFQSHPRLSPLLCPQVHNGKVVSSCPATIQYPNITSYTVNDPSDSDGSVEATALSGAPELRLRLSPQHVLKDEAGLGRRGVDRRGSCNGCSKSTGVGQSGKKGEDVFSWSTPGNVCFDVSVGAVSVYQRAGRPDDVSGGRARSRPPGVSGSRARGRACSVRPGVNSGDYAHSRAGDIGDRCQGSRRKKRVAQPNMYGGGNMRSFRWDSFSTSFGSSSSDEEYNLE